jgi:SAM-dependent methyltransferase
VRVVAAVPGAAAFGEVVVRDGGVVAVPGVRRRCGGAVVDASVVVAAIGGRAPEGMGTSSRTDSGRKAPYPAAARPITATAPAPASTSVFRRPDRGTVAVVGAGSPGCARCERMVRYSSAGHRVPGSGTGSSPATRNCRTSRGSGSVIAVQPTHRLPRRINPPIGRDRAHPHDEGVTDENGWLKLLAEKPGHSRWYVERFRKMARDGADLHGEARTIDAMAPRGARILDAGCGGGRVGGRLAALGHDVVGVDLDPELIAAAVADHPGPRWLAGDLSALDLPDRFDVIVSAGNVMTFVAPSTRVEILRRLRAHLAAGGRVVIGFGAGRGYAFDDFLADAATAGLTAELLLATWDLRPFTPDADFLVATFT